ncbi:MAG: type II/IV secretion system protein [Sulfuricella sp.]|nr:type II/IV secretion system protein [Sulfuricella sp.]
MNLADVVSPLNPVIIRHAHERARELGTSVFIALEESTGWEPRRLLGELAVCFGFKVAEALDMHQWTGAFDLLPLPKALQKECALFRTDQEIIAVIPDPFDQALQLWLESRAQTLPEFRLALRADIATYLAQQEESARAIENVDTIADLTRVSSHSVEQLSLKTISEDTSPIVRIVNSTLYDALKAGASDIHIETGRSGIVVKYRIDGVLDLISTINGLETAEQVISRIKVMAELDIAERRVPQDGRFKIAIRGRDIDLRVSIMPCIHGEDAVIRILDKHAIVPTGSRLTLDLLRFSDSDLVSVRRLALQSYGMLLVTGPTGSGKTTTLYAALSEINRGHDKVVTIEDPVEYELPGVLQIPVNEKKGLTFAKGLRSILRHDPDKIMVGEIRDAETAEIAVQSALTGHLVLTTVHANNVFDVFNRFAHMGIDPYSLTSALNGVWAQRLIRTVCGRCGVEYQPTEEELSALDLAHDQAHEFRFRKGIGCGDCRGTGYKGRRAIAEILTLNDHLRELIAAKSSIITIKQEAVKNGTRFLRQAALDLVRQGETTFEEVERVTLRV